MIRRLLAKALTRPMLWLLTRKFKGAPVVALVGKRHRTLYCRGVTVEQTPQGALFSLRCYEDRFPVITPTNKTPERVRVLAYRQIYYIGGGVYAHDEERDI